MTRTRLLLRTLGYFWASNLAVAAGVAVGTAVLAGSLLVGASVRGSLVEIAERRLGGVDHVMVTPHLFTAALAGRLERRPDFARDFEGAEAVLALPGGVSVPGTGGRAGRVSVLGRGSLEVGSCVLSHALARDLGVTVGEVVVLRVDRRGRVPAESPLGAEKDEVAILRLRVARVAAESGFEDSFGLHATQRAVRNVWVSRDELAGRIDAEARANVMLVRARAGRDGPEAARRLENLLKGAATVEDYGLKLLGIGAAMSAGVILESDRIFIDPEVERALDGMDLGRSPPKILAYLADTIRDLRTGREVPYSMVAGMSAPPGGRLAADEIVLNRWAADDLAARPGDSIQLAYLVRSDGGLLEKKTAAFRLARVIETEAPGADRSLVPRFKGLTDAERMGTWDAPREMRFDASRVRPVDEEYWDEHRAAPKAFIALPKARELWGTRWGSLTSVRFPRARRGDIERKLAAALEPGAAGLVFRSIRSEQMRAAAGSTDFSGLFVGFSMFLVAGAALLVALLMKLSIEQRTRQVGVMLALGFTERGVRRLFMTEGLAVLAAGAAAGAGLAVGYAWLMMAGLGTLWRGAVGTTLLSLHVDWSLLGAGTAGGFLVGALAAWRAIAGVRAMAPAAALAGKTPGDGGSAGSREFPGTTFALVMSLVMSLVMAGVALPVVAAATDAVSEAPAFFGSGVCILAAALVGFRAWLRRAGRAARGTVDGPGRLGIVNAARNPTRSMLTVGLLATAVFVVAAVGAMRGAVPLDAGRASGTGGYSLVADFDVAVPYDLSLAEGRRLLGLDTGADAEGDVDWARVRFAGMRASPGEDASCRNLYRPSRPRVLSAPAAFAEEGRFSFAASLDLAGLDAGASPWRLLDAKLPGGAIPAIADVESARWIMHKALGDAVTVKDEKGRERELRIVALLDKGIFQAELLVGERDFRALYPSRAGYKRFLVDVPSADVPKDDVTRVAASLRERLARFGPEIEPAGERLAGFMRIANSYISAFQLLGGLGVLLGSLGLIVVLARAVVERRREIALMSAIGFRRRSVAWMLVAENVFLLAAGTIIGVAAAAIAVAPAFAGRAPGVTSALLTAALVAATGVFVVTLTTWTAVALVRRVSPGLLRRE